MIHPNAAGIDVGAKEHVVAVPADRDPEPVRSFKAFTPDLYELGRLAQGMRSRDGGFGIDGHLLDHPLRDP